MNDTFLIDAAKTCNLARCRALLEEGADVNVADNLRWTALHCASAHGDAEICKLLLSAGADIHALDNTLWTPLHFAANSGHIEVCRLLIERGANLEAETERGKTALHSAAQNGCVGACREMIQSGANMQALDANRYTPLRSAVMHGKIEVVRFFFEECGEDVDQRFFGKKTLDDLARDSAEPDMAEFLAAYRLSLTTQEKIENALMDDSSAVAASRSRGFAPL